MGKKLSSKTVSENQLKPGKCSKAFSKLHLRFAWRKQNLTSIQRGYASSRLCPRCSSLLSLRRYLLVTWRLTNMFTCSLSCGAPAQTKGSILCKGRHWHPVWWWSGRGSWCDGSQPWRQGVIKTSHCSSRCWCSCSIGLYRQGWMQEEYGTGGISINAQRFGFEKWRRRMKLYGSRVAIILSGCPSRGAWPLQSRWMKSKGWPGSLLVNLCLKFGEERPLQKCLSLPTFAFYLHLEGLHKGVKLYKCSRIGMGRVLSNHGVFWLLFISPQTQVLAGTGFSVWLINFLPPYMEMPLLIIIITLQSFVAFLADVSQSLLKKKVRTTGTISHIAKPLQRDR